MRFAISTIMVQDNWAKLNIQNVLLDLSATSKEEAIGYAHLEAQERFPEHYIFSTAFVEIVHNTTEKGE